ncbi:MAG: rRNA adenine N-6-methyltransferase family protein [Candidatus Aenigmatarchaeota archaeon]
MRHAISAEPVPKDQHLMTNQGTVDKIVAAAKLKHGDYVLEIGAGSGLLTLRLASKGARVLAIEMDKRFATTLGKIEAANVEIIYANAIDLIDKIKFNKVVSNIPYAICEPLVSRLMKKEFEIAVLSVPESFYKILTSKPGEKTHSILSLKAQSFFSTELLFIIDKNDFSPPPKTESVAIAIRPLSKSDYEKNPGAFVFRELFMQKTKKLGNALAEALINAGRMPHGEQLTKRTAKAKIKEMELGKLLQKKVEEMRLDDLMAVKKKLTISS